MRTLADVGLTPFEMLSPVYGGDTAETEFETLTGLSSAVLPGIDFQQFATRYRAHADALPRRFADAGYLTVSMHNYHGLFWRRSTVHPKLGFQESRFLDQMDAARWPDNGPSTWARDAILYDSALRRYQQAAPGQKVFLYLITVSTHGAFQDEGGDLGKNFYLGRMRTAMADMRDFLTRIEAAAKARGRPLAIIVFGDHKPALSGVFYADGVLPHSLFNTHDAKSNKFDFVFMPTPEDWKIRSEVSVYARMPNPADTQKLIAALNDRPMFCLPGELAALTPGGDERFWRGVNAVCHKPEAELVKPDGAGWEQDFPLPLYAERLFPLPAASAGQ